MINNSLSTDHNDTLLEYDNHANDRNGQKQICHFKQDDKVQKKGSNINNKDFGTFSHFVQNQSFKREKWGDFVTQHRMIQYSPKGNEKKKQVLRRISTMHALALDVEVDAMDIRYRRYSVGACESREAMCSGMGMLKEGASRRRSAIDFADDDLSYNGSWSSISESALPSTVSPPGVVTMEKQIEPDDENLEKNKILSNGAFVTE